MQILYLKICSKFLKFQESGMPAKLIREVRQELSLCLVGSPGIHPLLSVTRPPLCSSSSCHHQEMCFGWECENLQEARRLEARGGDDAHPAFLAEPPLT